MSLWLIGVQARSAPRLGSIEGVVVRANGAAAAGQVPEARVELAPGQTAQGFLTYEISGAASQLMLSVKLDDDTASFALT